LALKEVVNLATKEVILSDEVEVINQARDQCTSWSANRSLRIGMGFLVFFNFCAVRLGCPRDLKLGNRKYNSITVLTFSVISNILWELYSELGACSEI